MAEQFPWIVNLDFKDDPRQGIRVRHIESANDGDVCNSIVTYKILGGTDKKYAIDIGMFEGWWSFFAADVNPNIEIDGFEPNPKSFQELVTRLNEIPQLRLHNYALSNKSGFLPLSIEGGQSNSRSDGGNTVNVPCTTIGRYIRDKHVDMIKIDTEGHDLYILNSLHPYLNQIDAIVFECTVYWYGSSRDECIKNTLHELTHLKNRYKYMYALSRRGPASIYPIEMDALGNVIESWYDMHYQLDILVCDHPPEKFMQ